MYFSKSHILILTITLVVGYIIGKSSVSIPKPNKFIHHISHFKKEECKQVYAKNKIVKHDKKEIPPKRKTIQERIEDFDAYEYKREREESKSKWKESVNSLLSEYIEDKDSILEEYEILRSELKEKLDNEWKKIMESTRVGENEYLLNTTFQQELVRMNIKSAYHNKLRQLLGTEVYDLLQRKIKRCREQQVTNARDNLPRGFCPRF